MTKKNKNPGCSQPDHPAGKADNKNWIEPMAKSPKFKAPPCKHPNLVPYTMRAERITFNANVTIIDKECSIINGQCLKVTKYYCPGCNKYITPPKE